MILIHGGWRGWPLSTVSSPPHLYFAIYCAAALARQPDGPALAKLFPTCGLMMSNLVHHLHPEQAEWACPPGTAIQCASPRLLSPLPSSRSSSLAFLFILLTCFPHFCCPFFFFSPSFHPHACHSPRLPPDTGPSHWPPSGRLGQAGGCCRSGRPTVTAFLLRFTSAPSIFYIYVASKIGQLCRVCTASGDNSNMEGQ